MNDIVALLVAAFLVIVAIMLIVPIILLIKGFVQSEGRDKEPFDRKDYFYLVVNAMFPFILIGAEGILKWSGNSRELGSYWIVGTISAAMGLLMGNLKPKELSANQQESRLVNTDSHEYVVFHKRDNNIIRWCWLLLFVEFLVWMYASIAVAKNELSDFWTNLLLTIVIYGLSLYMSYRKELV